MKKFFFLFGVVVFLLMFGKSVAFASSDFKFVSNSVCYTSQKQVFLGFPRYKGDIVSFDGYYRIRYRIANQGNSDGTALVYFKTGLNPYEMPGDLISSTYIKANSYVDVNLSRRLTTTGNLGLYLRDSSEENPYIYSGSYLILNTKIPVCLK